MNSFFRGGLPLAVWFAFAAISPGPSISAQSSPAATPPTMEEVMRRLDALQKKYDELQRRMDTMNGASAASEPAPAAPAESVNPPPVVAEAAPIAAPASPGASKVFNPDIAMIGNFVGFGGRHSAMLGGAPRSFELTESELSVQAVLDPYARGGDYPHLVRYLEKNVHFAELLENNEDLVPELLSHQREAHELFILIPVAHDEMIGVLGEAENSLQLGLAAALEPDARSLPEFDDLFDYVPLLIHLDRIHGGVCARVVVLLYRVGESGVQRFDARSQDVGESKQQRKADPLRFEIVGKLEEVELTRRLSEIGTDDYMTCFTDVEVADAPAFNVVKCPGRLDRPRLGGFGELCGLAADYGGIAGYGHAQSLGHCAARWYRRLSRARHSGRPWWRAPLVRSPQDRDGCGQVGERHHRRTPRRVRLGR